MQIVKLVFLDSLKCAISIDMRHNITSGQRHVKNLTRKNDVKKLVKTGSNNSLTEMKRMHLLYCILNVILFIVHYTKVYNATQESNRTNTKYFMRF